MSSSAEQARKGISNTGGVSKFVLSCLLLPVALVSLIYSWNLNRIEFSDYLWAAGFLIACNLVLLVVLRRIFGNRFDTGVLAGCLFTGMFFGAYFAAALVPFWAVAWLGLGFLLTQRPSIGATLGNLVNCIAVAVLALAAYNLVLSPYLWESSMRVDAAVQSFKELPKVGNEEVVKRDIYYIVLDRYARADQLRDVYGFDNNPFLEALAARGFVIADNAYSNYQRTGHSLASSLNLDYLDDVGGGRETVSSDWKPIYSLIENSVTARFLKRQGYGFHFFGSWWEPTRTSRIADEVVNYRAAPELLRLVLENSALGYVADKFQVAAINPRQIQCERARKKFDALVSLARSDAADRSRFIFAHFLVPHPPFVLEADGSCLSIEIAEARSRAANYIAQVKYANAQLLRFIDAAQGRGGMKPVIILQADEGPWPERFVRDELRFLGRDVSDVNWLETSPAELREKMGILNALYLPDVAGSAIGPDASPVNNLRTVLREYFGADLPQLRDTPNVFANGRDLYRFHDVSGKLGRD